MCLETTMIYECLLICMTSIFKVTIPYLLVIPSGMCVIRLLSLDILFFCWTIFPSIAALAGPSTMLAIFICLLSTPHSLIPPLSIASAKSLPDGKHRHSLIYLATSALLLSTSEQSCSDLDAILISVLNPTRFYVQKFAF